MPHECECMHYITILASPWFRVAGYMLMTIHIFTLHTAVIDSNIIYYDNC